MPHCSVYLAVMRIAQEKPNDHRIVSFNRHPGMDRAEMVRNAAGTFER